MKNQAYETVIGLEVHIQLNTNSKAFSAEKNEFNLSPNEHISAVTLALPGTLPVANASQVEKAIKLGVTFGCAINEYTYFDRKNYFYPDLPKGYQITQDSQPICVGGKIDFVSEGQARSIRIHHIHMEEDAGKSTHDQSDSYSLIDYNRAGTPLVELVTEPDFRSGQEVFDFLAQLQKVVQYLEISDGNMEEGSIRCDCNVSLRPMGTETYGERREIKNVNSKRFAKMAIESEAYAQEQLLNAGEKIYKTTMLFDTEHGITRPMRKKETENDYRYFTEPDLTPLHITEYRVAQIKKSIDWLPSTISQHLEENLGVQPHHIEVITDEKSTALYFLALAAEAKDVKELADLFVLKLLPQAKVDNLDLDQVLTKAQIVNFVALLSAQKVSKSNAFQTLFPAVVGTDKMPSAVAKELSLITEEDTDLVDKTIADVMAQNPDKVKEYRSGKKGLIGFFIGQIMKEAGNKADPKTLNAKVSKALEG